jgi:hypothetical protein
MNRKQRRANKIPSQAILPQVPKTPPKYQVTFAGSNPDKLSRKERAIVLVMIPQVPHAVHLVEQNPVLADETDPPFDFDNVHVHVMFDETRKVCLRWHQGSVARVVEGKCESLG